MAHPAVLVAIDVLPASLDRLRGAYPVHIALTHEARMAAAARHGAEVGAILTNGTTSIPRALIAALPALAIICAQGVGHEGVDLEAAREHGVAVTNGAGTNAATVADHAMALTLALLRDVCRADAAVRDGRWDRSGYMRPTATGQRVGLLGLGDIGQRIARRCAGFDMPVAYHSRRQVPGVGCAYAATPLALAEMSDVLIIAVPGGHDTRHLVGAAELAALGPGGFLVNVGRGSVVDTAALVAALQQGRLAGAALDVVEGEPAIPPALRALPNVVLTPHIGGRSPEAARATMGLVLDNLAARFAGRPVLTPVSLAGAPLAGRAYAV